MSDKITIKLERHLAHALCRGGELAKVYGKGGN